MYSSSFFDDSDGASTREILQNEILSPLFFFNFHFDKVDYLAGQMHKELI